MRCGVTVSETSPVCVGEATLAQASTLTLASATMATSTTSSTQTVTPSQTTTTLTSASTSTTMTSTTTPLWVVSATMGFSSTGTAERVVAVVASYLIDSYNVEADQLTVVIGRMAV
eukprot:6774933-Pyramimonas_sp.AAC.1